MTSRHMAPSYPIIVIGSGVAGLLSAATLSKRNDVILLTKKKLSDSITGYSQGGIAAVWSDLDSPRQHSDDTLNAGAGLCDPKAVEILTTHSRAAIEKLIELGTRFDKNENGEYLLGLEGAHKIPRILHAGGDATGAEIQRALMAYVKNNPAITVLEDAFVTKLRTSESGITGLTYYDRQNTACQISANRIILATGGAGRVYRYTSNPDTATGDGVILAYLAGADLMDMEFFQFHPTALCLPGAPNFLISEAMRGEGAILRDANGMAFMHDHHPLKDLAPRDIVARKIVLEIKKGDTDHLFLDATGIGERKIVERFPTIFRTCSDYGLDIRKEGIPINPVAHYFMGGVATDLWGRTSIPGLYACGEVARTGVHGANRLASNSLLEGAVFALRIGEIFFRDLTDSQVWKKSFTPVSLSKQSGNKTINYDSLSMLMWKNAGIVRDRVGLKFLTNSLKDTSLHFEQKNWSPLKFELFSLTILGKLIAESAYLREESRGGHFRLDFPKIDLKLNRSKILNIQDCI